CRHPFVRPARATRSLRQTEAEERARATVRPRRGSIMEIIGAAALIAVGLVFAALVYGRTHRTAGTGAQRRTGSPEQTDRELAERSAALARREDAVARRDAAL